MERNILQDPHRQVRLLISVPEAVPATEHLMGTAAREGILLTANHLKNLTAMAALEETLLTANRRKNQTTTNQEPHNQKQKRTPVLQRAFFGTCVRLEYRQQKLRRMRKRRFWI